MKKEEFSFGNPYFSDTDNYQKLEEEQFEVVKNGVKTIITCKFTQAGYLVSFSSKSEKQEILPVKEQKMKGRFIKRRMDK